ncbi:MAG: GC-type dockerin domain-anchored protein [Phycisphaerales bacterium]
MTRTHSTVALLGLMGLASAPVSAQTDPIGPFDGHRGETFESFEPDTFASLEVFGGGATMSGVGGRIQVAGLLSGDCVAMPHEGDRFAASPTGYAWLEFDHPIDAFGGWFASATDVAGQNVLVRLYDDTGLFIGQLAIALGEPCSWRWTGWNLSFPIGRIEIEGPAFGGALVLIDSLEIRVACDADFDDDGRLSAFDFLAFFNAFEADDPTADFDGDGALTVFDFLLFQNAFDAGCP